MDTEHDTAIETVLEQLIVQGPEGIATVFARAFEIAMRIERANASWGHSATSARPTGGATRTDTSPSGSIRPPAR